MAIYIPSEDELQKQIEQVEQLDGEFRIKTGTLKALAHGFYRFKEVLENLHRVFPAAGGKDAAAYVAFLAGFYRGKQLVGKASDDAAAIAAWRVWAHLRLGRGGDPLGDDMEMRGTIGDLIDRYEP